ncbi:MAG TPA: VCBS repeat-containing protein, partial [Gemmatimonadaceae bacterium]
MRSPAVSFVCALTAVSGYLCTVSARAVDPVSFTDVTKDTRITFSHVWSTDKKYILESMSGGGALFDFDNDGLLDVYLVNSPTVATAGDARSARSELWRNLGNGTFANVTEKAGVGYPGWGMGAVSADFDNDGWSDLYVTCYGPNRLYRNNHDGTFSEVAGQAGVADPRWSTGAAFADYDGDGWLDLFVANYIDVRLNALPEFGKGKFCEFHGIPVQCGPRGLAGAGDSLYRNKGDGTFEDVSVKAGVADAAHRFGMGAVWSDFDGDGRPDLYVANDAGPNYLYKNNGDGTFRDVALQAGTALSEDGKEQGSMGVAIADYDHSGGWSVFVTNFSDEYNALYRHERDFLFTDASYASRTAKSSLPFVGWGVKFFD